MKERKDDFEIRHRHLSEKTEKQLETRFWELAGLLTDPMIELARTHTSPSIERSVLLRMGFSSIEAKAIVNQTIDHDLMGKGAGHVVYRIASEKQLDIRNAGLALADGKYWNDAQKVFRRNGSAK